MPATPEYIQQVIDQFRNAAQANQSTPTLEGNVVVLTPDVAEEVMITADLHGHRRNFNSIKKISALDEHPKRHLILQEVCHGGPLYPNSGGCMSHAMLEDVARLKVQYPDRVHFLLSNHELAELTEYPIIKAKRMLNLLFRMGMQEMYGAAISSVRQASLEFIESCPMAVRLPGGVFICHSAPEQVDLRGFDKTVFERPIDRLDMQETGDVFAMVWGRDYRQENASAFAKLVNAKVLIHGHEPCPEGFAVPNDIQIILDCCDEPACYVILPVGPELTQAQIVSRIEKLP